MDCKLAKGWPHPSCPVDHCLGRNTLRVCALLLLCRMDPIDRTVGWVFQQHQSNRPCGRDPGHAPCTPGDEGGTEGYETSVSRCESDRGTQGRGTPPARDDKRPRLDELFRQLQVWVRVCVRVRVCLQC